MARKMEVAAVMRVMAPKTSKLGLGVSGDTGTVAVVVVVVSESSETVVVIGAGAGADMASETQIRGSRIKQALMR